jgi:diguanylate cyclase (GGDEF)-like protein/PAS domain S-box-containing protein
LKDREVEELETERIRRLSEYHVLRTSPEAAFDDVVRLAVDIFKVPIAFICMTEEDKHWFKSKIGIELVEVPRSISFCDHTLRCEGVMVVPDATKDERFSKSPMVTGPHHIRFYAGVTLRDADGFALGTLVIADVVPRQIPPSSLSSLQRLAGIILDRLELRKAHSQLQTMLRIAEDGRQTAISDNAELRQVLECLPEAIVVMDSENRLLLWNGNYERMFAGIARFLTPGIPYEFMLQKSLDLRTYSVDENAESRDAWIKERMEFHNREGATCDIELEDGRWIRYNQHLTPDRKKICVRTDVTADKIAEESFRLLFDNNPIPMMIYDQSTLSYLDVNNAAVNHYGYSKEQFSKMTLLDIRPQGEREKITGFIQKQAGFSNGEIDWTHIKRDGGRIVVNIYARPIEYYGSKAALVSVVDVTERRRHDALIQFQAEHDHLTELPNRRRFMEELDSTLTAPKKDGATTLVLIDIDNFKSINDTLGHQVGDSLIVSVAEKLRLYFGENALVARLGGDEFAILLTHHTQIEYAKLAADELISSFAKPLKVEEHLIQIGISAGVSFSDSTHAISGATLLMHADMALYKAKFDGRGMSRVYEPQMSLQLLLHRETEQDLRSALAEDQLEVYYQPLVNLDGGSVLGYEALLRWNHPVKGMIAPSTFIPIAESSGLILSIGRWVLAQACIEATTWPRFVSIAVNVSAVQFKSANLVDTVANALRISGLEPKRLELEITESVLLEKSSDILEILRQLKGLGISIALDDFGTGFSGLGYLNNFPIDKIKIDRSFVTGLSESNKSVELVRAAIGIGQGMGIRTLAEGIETKEQLAILKALGCQQGQGYLFGAAVPASRISNRIALDQSRAS